MMPLHSFILARRPSKLLLVSTGNIANVEPEALLLANLSAISAAFDGHAFVKLSQSMLLVHV